MSKTPTKCMICGDRLSKDLRDDHAIYCLHGEFIIGPLCKECEEFSKKSPTMSINELKSDMGRTKKL